MDRTNEEGGPLSHLVVVYRTGFLISLAIGIAAFVTAEAYYGSLDFFQIVLIVALSLVAGSTIGPILVGRLVPVRVVASQEAFTVGVVGRFFSQPITFAWPALVQECRASWTPIFGRKIVIRCEQAAGRGVRTFYLSPAQAKLLSTFPVGAFLRGVVE